MAGSKEIRNKIKSVQNTRKITKAMQMVAASKMKKAQDRMRAARPYLERMLYIASHTAQAHLEYRHPFLTPRENVKNICAIVMTSDKGLCGGLNTNILRLVLQQHKEWIAQGKNVCYMALGAKGLSFLSRMDAKIIASATQLGDIPHLDQIVGPLKTVLDDFTAGKIDEVALFSTGFINTMRQVPRKETLIPIPREFKTAEGELDNAKGVQKGSWDYIYEPDAKTLLEGVMRRYVEAQLYGVLAENMASEQSSRMVAMKAASDNASKIVKELNLVYNKTRQAAITQEINEIVGGAAAV
jgi:F-type H+-transporting ATPase subunit gamma